MLGFDYFLMVIIHLWPLGPLQMLSILLQSIFLKKERLLNSFLSSFMKINSFEGMICFLVIL